MSICQAVGKLLYANGDVYLGQHRAFLRDGQGKMIYQDGSTYEGGWSYDKKHGQGFLRDQAIGNVYSGGYQDGRKDGHGRMFYADKREVYDGEWMNDKRQGEGSIIDSKGVVCRGTFRTDQMEGKLAYQSTLSAAETEKIFRVLVDTNDMFISVNKKSSSSKRNKVTRHHVLVNI